jgi:hypothetical protein
VIFTDNSAIKYFLTKPDSKQRLIRWILLLQGFDLEVRDKKGSENLVAYHLSRLVNVGITEKEKEVREEFDSLSRADQKRVISQNRNIATNATRISFSQGFLLSTKSKSK